MTRLLLAYDRDGQNGKHVAEKKTTTSAASESQLQVVYKQLFNLDLLEHIELLFSPSFVVSTVTTTTTTLTFWRISTIYY